MQRSDLKHFAPLELLLLYKHVKLGKKHLRHWLSEEEIAEILALTREDQETEREIKADTSEVIGGVSLVLNTIFTATFGAWMGISGFLKLSLNKPFLFFSLLLFCSLVGGYIGFFQYQFTKKAAQNAVDQKQMKEIELSILKTLKFHRSSEMEHKRHDLNDLLKKLHIDGMELLDIPAEEFDDHEVCLNWLNQIDRAIKDLEKNKEMAHFFSTEVKAVKSALEEAKARDQKRKKGLIAHIVHKLTDSLAHPPLPSSSWVRDHSRQILISLTPVLLGGFSSLFVYLGGAPRIAEEMSQTKLYEFLSQPVVKYTELVMAIGMTCFFAYSSVHSNWKSFKRDQEWKKITALTTREETDLQLMDDQFLKMKQVEDVMKPIGRMYLAFKKLL